jgi:hypothetical protein
LIVIAARGLVAKLPPARPKPSGRVVKRRGMPRRSFQLFDPRKHFFRQPATRYTKNPPLVWVAGDDWQGTVYPPWSPRQAPPAPPPPDNTVDTQRLCRRLEALKLALADLPRQAQRLVRAQARREKVPSLRFKSPKRPGCAPGYRKKPTHEVDEVLKECHWLAWEATRHDTS